MFLFMAYVQKRENLLKCSIAYALSNGRTKHLSDYRVEMSS